MENDEEGGDDNEDGLGNEDNESVYTDLNK